MRFIEDATTDELVAEIEKRRAQDLLSTAAKRPRPKDLVNIRPLIEMVERNLNVIEETGASPKDFDHYVYEMALTAIYGDEIWPWISAQVDY